MINFNFPGLSPELLKAVYEKGFEKPTPVQEKTIPHILETETDLIALAQTGTGKTAAFGLPIIQKTDDLSKKTQALILCPTRELCIQVANDLTDFSIYYKNINVVPVYGGANIETQIKALSKGAQIVVGTPGRTLDLINRKKLILSEIKILVLDEADEMLSMGFKDDLDAILDKTGPQKQTLLFSATMPEDIAKIAKKYMKSPEEITLGFKNASAENVEHIYYMVNAKDRYLALKRIADINPNIYGIIFCRTRHETKEVADKLMQDGYNADALHGDLSQAQRDYVMQRFREKHLQLLVATDIAARGLDVNDLTHIINYNLPDELEVYIHRSGRTGRAGKKGISVTIIHGREHKKIKTLEERTKKKFERKPVPNGKEICEKQLYNLIDKIEKTEVDETQIEPFMPVIYKKLSWLNREDLIKHFVSAEFNRFLSYYKNSEDLNVSAKDNSRDRDERKPKDRDRKRKRNQENDSDKFSRFFISLGKKDKISPSQLIGIVNEALDNDKAEIGKIDILDSFSFFEVEKKYEQDIISNTRDMEYRGISFNVELSSQQKSKKNKNNKNDDKSSKHTKEQDKSKDFKRKKNKKKY